MRGLWHLQTELLNIGLHRPVLNTIFFFIVACLTFLPAYKSSTPKPCTKQDALA